MLVADTTETEDDLIIETKAMQLVESDMESSINAFTCQVGFTTIRILGYIKKQKVTLLLYSSSTHSFID